jgi:hypothetical protein
VPDGTSCPADEFAAALRANVVIRDVAAPGALPAADALTLRDWWDRERRRDVNIRDQPHLQSHPG